VLCFGKLGVDVVVDKVGGVSDEDFYLVCDSVWLGVVLGNCRVGV
jgi:hypothetical protein